MNKSVWKKPVALGLAFTMMLSMAACGKKDSNGGSGDSSSKDYGDVKDMVFSGTEVEMTEVKGDPSSFVVAGDKVYFTATEWPEYTEEEVGENGETNEEESPKDVEEAVTEESSEASTEESSEETSKEDEKEPEKETSEENSDVAEDASYSEESYDNESVETITRIYSMNKDCSDIKEICQPNLETNEYINFLLVDKDGGIKVFTSSWDDKAEKQTYFISALDESGNVSDKKDVSKELGLGDDDYVTKVITDDKNRVIVVADQKVYVLSSDLKKVGDIAAEANVYIEGAAMTPDGKVVCGSSGENGACAQLIDIDSMKLGEKYDLGLSYFNGSGLLDGCDKYDFYFSDDKGIYGYSVADKKENKILDYLASEIDFNYSYGITPISEDTMIGTGWDEETSKSKFVVYTKVDPSSVKDKETITFGSVWGVDSGMRSAAIKFNKENDKYRIEFKDYSDIEDWNDVQNKVNADFAAGNIPDIIDLNNLPFEQYANKGILEDLTPYFEKDDSVNLDDILPSVKKAMEIDGKLYYLAPSFGVYSVIASKKDVGDKTGWTFNEMKELLDEKGEGVRPFYSENKIDVLNSFLYTCIDDYIDWSTGKCRFDSDDFKALMEIAGRGTDEETDYSEDAPTQPELIKSGKMLFVDGWVDVESIQVYKKMYNSDISFVGYPCEDKQGSFFVFDSQYAIYSKSKVKDGAWEFIKSMMTKDYQASGYHIWNNPTNKDAFEMYMKTKTATKEYTDEYGQVIQPLESSWGWGDVDIKIGPLSAEEEKLYRDLINNTTKVSSNNTAISDIITEEAKNYFSGQKSVDETADIIQNRVTTYVNENR